MIKLEIECDHCGKGMEINENYVCGDCYELLVKKVEELEDMVKTLKRKLKESDDD